MSYLSLISALIVNIFTIFIGALAGVLVEDFIKKVYITKRNNKKMFEYFSEEFEHRYNVKKYTENICDNRLHLSYYTSFGNFMCVKIYEMGYFKYSLLIMKYIFKKITLDTNPPYDKKDGTWTLCTDVFENYYMEFEKIFKNNELISYDEVLDMSYKLQSISNNGQMDNFILLWNNSYRYKSQNSLFGLYQCINEFNKKKEKYER